MKPTWTIEEAFTEQPLTPEAAEQADNILVAELELTATLISYAVLVGRLKQARGLLTAHDRERFRELENGVRDTLEVLNNLVGQEDLILTIGGEQ